MDPHRPRIPPSLAPAADPLEATVVAPPPETPPDLPPQRPVLHRQRPGLWRRLKRALLWMLLTLFLLALVPPGFVLWLRWNPPPTSAFMLQSPVKPVAYQWVPRERIPASLRDAVVAAEDQKFWTHWGFDFIAIAEALEHNEKSRRTRGASTITQQTAKNLFLWPSRSWLRKGLEVSFTLLLEGLWTKDRILEVYLNVAEFGPGIYGVQAAAQKFFGKPAEQLTAGETAQLAAVLPNPRKWRADRPGPYVQSRVDWILVHTGHAPRFAPPPPAEELPPEPGIEGEAPAEAPLSEMPAPPEAEQPPAEGEPAPEAPAPDSAPAEEPATAPATGSEGATPAGDEPAEAGSTEKPLYAP